MQIGQKGLAETCRNISSVHCARQDINGKFEMRLKNISFGDDDNIKIFSFIVICHYVVVINVYNPGKRDI